MTTTHLANCNSPRHADNLFIGKVNFRQASPSEISINVRDSGKIYELLYSASSTKSVTQRLNYTILLQSGKAHPKR